MAIGPNGDLYVNSGGGDCVCKVTPGGAVKILAIGDPLNGIQGVALDARGNLFVANGDGSIVEITPFSVSVFIDRFSGLGAPITGLAFDMSGNLYVAGTVYDAIFKITPDGAITLFADSPLLPGPAGLAFDSSGNLYASTQGGNIVKIDSSGHVSPFVSGLPGNLQFLTFAPQFPLTMPTVVPNANHTGGMLALTVSDPIAAADGTSYSLDGAAFLPYDGPIAINDPFLHIVLSQSTDTAGNTGALQSSYFAFAPVALSLSPDQVAIGSGPTPFILGGAGFDANCVICLDGHALTTTFMDADNLAATLPNFTEAQPHTLTVTDKGVHPHLVSNPLILSVGKVRLTVSTTLSRDGSNNVVATLTFKDTGPIDATGVTLNTATLTNLTIPGSVVSPTSPTLPYRAPTVTAGSSQTVTLTFPASVGTSGQAVRLTLM
jgi:hypothetical protein